MRIFLVGFMGVGKSALGKGLAAELGLRFIDLDKEIEKHFGKDAAAVFASEGESAFRDVESQKLAEAIESDDFVLATGGGTACFGDNMQQMNESGTTIYLKMSTDHLMQRLEPESDSRPMLGGKTGHELWTLIHELLQEREPDYLKAHYKVKAWDLKAPDLAEFLRLYKVVPGLETEEADTEGDDDSENEEEA
ncbi:MAG TPA: shikimate kinase [Bacteroidia bacterium]|nr:shikimate kinase [Bacteroidia bacterium]